MGKQYLSKIKPKHYLAIFLAARQGFPKTKIAAELKVSKASLQSWLREDECAREAYVTGRTEFQGANFMDYCYRHLPPDLQDYWDRLEAVFKANEERGVRDFIGGSPLSKRNRQYIFVHALAMNNFNASQAARLTGVPHGVWHSWCKEPKFKKMVMAVQDMKKDFVEGQLMNLVAAGDTAAVIFANKTLNSDRGYSPAKKVEVSGVVEHQHTVNWDDVLDRLSLTARKEVMHAITQLENGDQKPKALPAHGREEEEMLIQDAEFELAEKAAKEREADDEGD